MNHQKDNMFSENTFTFEKNKNGVTNELMEQLYRYIVDRIEEIKYGNTVTAKAFIFESTAQTEADDDDEAPADEEAVDEEEEELRCEAAKKSYKYDDKFKINLSGKGYICPVCNTSNYSFNPCVKCYYVPPISKAKKSESLDDNDLIEITCPNCNELLSFYSNEQNARCPWCDSKITLK